MLGKGGNGAREINALLSCGVYAASKQGFCQKRHFGGNFKRDAFVGAASRRPPVSGQRRTPAGGRRYGAPTGRGGNRSFAVRMTPSARTTANQAGSPKASRPGPSLWMARAQIVDKTREEFGEARRPPHVQSFLTTCASKMYFSRGIVYDSEEK